jgi:drug/metabolite transporter (DMT)-like permease
VTPGSRFNFGGSAGLARRLPVLALFGCAALAGGNGVGIRFSNRELPPLWGACLRFALAAALLLALALILRLPLPRGLALAGALLYGTLNFAAGFGAFYLALVTLHAGFGQIVLALVPLATLVLAVVWRQEQLTATSLAAVVLASSGLIVMIQLPADAPEAWQAVALLLVSVLGLAQATVAARQLPQVHPVMLNAVGMAAASALLLIVSLLAGERPTMPASTETWIAIGYLATAGSVLVFVLLLVVVRHWSASRAAYVFVLSPLPAIALSAALDGEAVGIGLIVGGTLVMAAAYVGAIRPPVARA